MQRNGMREVEESCSVVRLYSTWWHRYVAPAASQVSGSRCSGDALHENFKKHRARTELFQASPFNRAPLYCRILMITFNCVRTRRRYVCTTLVVFRSHFKARLTSMYRLLCSRHVAASDPRGASAAGEQQKMSRSTKTQFKCATLLYRRPRAIPSPNARYGKAKTHKSKP